MDQKAAPSKLDGGMGDTSPASSKSTSSQTASPAEPGVRVFTKAQGEKEGYLEIPVFYSRTDLRHEMNRVWEELKEQKRKSSLRYVMRSWVTMAWTRLRLKISERSSKS